MNELKEIYMNLLEGKCYGKMVNNVKYPFFNVCLSYGRSTYQDNKWYLFWHNAGSSADIPNLKNLKWIIENIFNTKAEDFVKNYELR